MKFAHKLTLAILVVLALALSAMSYLSVSSNFATMLDSMATGYMEQHLLERYALEADLINQRSLGEDITARYISGYGEGMISYVESSQHWIALYYGEGADTIYSNLPEGAGGLIRLDMLQNEAQGYTILQLGERWLMLISSAVENAGEALWLVSAYDATPVFMERDRQSGFMLRMQLLTLFVAGLFVAVMANRLTRPLRRLNMTSRKIASGAYNARSRLESDDEIGELAANFNRMAEAVEEQMDHLNASVQQREDFVSAFTHEVKTPMTAIIGYSDLLRSQQVEPEVRRRAAHFIHRESKRLESLSQKLLTLMGLSASAAELLPVSLNHIFTDAARSVIPNLEGSACQLKIKPADEVLVRADRDLVADLLRNLILNALRAEPEDDAVRIGWQPEGDGRCRVLVADRGRGINADELARIVEPFYMVDKSRARREGSSGVGLALCQKIAELHGSALEIDSTEGEGTTVSFTLALAETVG